MVHSYKEKHQITFDDLADLREMTKETLKLITSLGDALQSNSPSDVIQRVSDLVSHYEDLSEFASKTLIYDKDEDEWGRR